MNKAKETGGDVLDRLRVSDRLLAKIRDQIVSGALPKGSKLPTERELAEQYGVSGPTVREAIRALSAMGLIKVRHGSGAYVTADSSVLVSLSLGAMIQLERPTITDILGVAASMTSYAARLACAAATQGDKDDLVAALHRMDALESAADAAASLRGFHDAIGLASHNRLLAVLYGFLTDLIVELSAEMVGDVVELWSSILGATQPLRASLVDAILSGDAPRAVELSEAYHEAAARLVGALPKAQEVRVNDPQFRAAVIQMLQRA
jgi:GntR family transcriptional regulator, transcriptional repressor for pyruvate dehydrogenase complex